MIETITQTMNDAVNSGIFPSAQLLVSKNGKTIFHKAFGNANIETVFDVASLTKPISTTMLAMQLVAENKLNLDDDISLHIKAFQNKGITIRHLLSHSSGLPAWEPYYQTVPEADIGTKEGKRQIISAICNEELAYKTGYQSEYSDLGFILLGEIIERATKSSLDKLFAERIAKPLGLENTFFVPLDLRTYALKHLSTGTKRGQATFFSEKVACPLFAPTEHCPWRKKVLQGEVHDQNCYAMGGSAGHAGLFSTTTDINKFITEFVACYRKNCASARGGSAFGGGKLLSQEIVQRFLPFHYKLTECNTTWLLGWDTPSHTNSQAGQHYSKKSIGHLGYTGCSMWIDLEKDFWIILLTNRIHPTTTNEKIRQFRPMIHNLIWEEMV